MDERSRSAYWYGQQLAQQEVIAVANKQMEKIVQNVLKSGVAKTVSEATALACKDYGQMIAGQLEHSLRMMGAADVKVTCP